MVCGQLLVLAPIQHRWVLVPILFQVPRGMGQCSASWSHCFLTRKKCNVLRSSAVDGSRTLHHQQSAGTSLPGHANITAGTQERHCQDEQLRGHRVCPCPSQCQQEFGCSQTLQIWVPLGCARPAAKSSAKPCLGEKC